MIKKRVVQRRRINPSLDTMRMRKRRRRRKQIRAVLICIISIAVLFSFIQILKLNAFQLKAFTFEGIEQETAVRIEQDIRSEYFSQPHLFGMIPATSVFFVREGQVQEDIALKYPNLYAVDVKNGLFGTMHIKAGQRERYGIWCGDVQNPSSIVAPLEEISIDTSNNTTLATSSDSDKKNGTAQDAPADSKQCFNFDHEGFVYEPQDQHLIEEGSMVYSGVLTEYPVGAHYLNNDTLKHLEYIYDTLKTLGYQTSHISCSKDLNCVLRSRTNGEIRLLLSKDANNDIVERLKVVFQQPALKDAHFSYIDMRFGKKVFYSLNKNVEPQSVDQLKQDTDN